MTKMNPFVVALAAMSLFLTTSIAFADAAPKRATSRNQATCTDDDDDDFCAAPDDDSKVLGWDCDDDNRSKHPGAAEIWDNGEDENCDGSDSVTPPLTLLRSFHVSPNDHPAVVRLMKELDACDAADECHVDRSAGKLPSRMDEGFYFVDTDCNGVREVIDQDKMDEVKIDALKGVFCHKPATQHRKRKPAAAVTLPGAATPTIAPVPQGKGRVQAPAIDPSIVAKAQVTADEAKVLAASAAGTAGQALVTSNEAKAIAAAQAVLVKAAGEGLVNLRGDLGAETKARKADVAKLQQQIGQVRDLTLETGKSVSKLQQSGPFVQLSLGGGLIGQRPLGSVDAGIKTRGMYAPGFRAGVNLGVMTPKYTVAAFGVALPLWDSGPSGMESGFAWQAGAESMKRVGSNLFLGGHALYQQHQSGGNDATGGNLLNPNAVARGVGVGFSAAVITSGQAHIGGQFRLTAGYETYAATPQGFAPTVESGPFVGISLDLLLGVGPSGKTKQTVAAPASSPSADDADEDDSSDDSEDK